MHLPPTAQYLNRKRNIQIRISEINEDSFKNYQLQNATFYNSSEIMILVPQQSLLCGAQFCALKASCSNITWVRGFEKEFIFLIIEIHLFQAKLKADKNRRKAGESLQKMVHSQRQEAAQQRREDKRRAEKERLLNEEDPEKARKLEVSERNRSLEARSLLHL